MGKKSKSKNTNATGKQSKLGARYFSRSHPEIAEKLRNGSMSPQEAVLDLEEKAIWDCVGGFRNRDEVDAEDEEEGNILLRHCYALARLATSEANDELFYLRFLLFSYFRIEEKLINLTDKFPSGDDDVFLATIQDAFNGVCDECKLHIEARTGKPLKETCPIYKVPFNEFRTIYIVIVKSNEPLDAAKAREVLERVADLVSRRGEMWKSAVGVREGTDRIRWVCWECGKECSEKLKCSLCYAARYCSKECQVEAWKSGHKCACSSLQKRYQGHEDNYRRIDRALKEGTICEGCTLHPSPELDYMMLPHFEMFTDAFAPIEKSCGLASIDTMYKNLAKLARGERLWMFDSKFSRSLKSFSQQPMYLGELRGHEQSQVSLCIRALAYDIDSRSTEAETVSFIQFWKGGIRNICGIYKCRPMTATRFIEIYYRIGLDDESIDTRRWDSIAQTFSIFKDHFHKNILLKPNDFEAMLQKFDWTDDIYGPAAAGGELENEGR